MKTNRLTRREEDTFALWLLQSLKERPDDFFATAYHLTDRKTGIQVWIGSGRGYVHVTEPVITDELRLRNRWKIWRATKQYRRDARNVIAKRLFLATKLEMGQMSNVSRLRR